MNDTDVLLETADRLLTEVVSGSRGAWPRAVAVAVRAALELELDAFWARVQPEVAGSPMRSRLLLLEAYAGPDLARTGTELWHGLSRATHHHAYELAPTAQELRAWHDGVIGWRQRLQVARQRGPGD